MGKSVFSHDSTFTLCKKLMIYKMMGSNVFINYSLLGIQMSYKFFGKYLTNFAIENTAASVFTGGVTTRDLTACSEVLNKRGIGSIGCYVVEGVRNAKNSELDRFLDFSLSSIKEITKGNNEAGHFALKLTAYISADLMERLNLAQYRFVHDVLKVNFDPSDESVLTKEQLKDNLASCGIVDY